MREESVESAASHEGSLVAISRLGVVALGLEK